MPPDDPSSFIPEDTIHADSRADYLQDAEAVPVEEPVDGTDETEESELPED